LYLRGRKGQKAGEKCKRSFIFITFIKYYSDYQIRENEMGGAHSKDRRDEKYKPTSVGKPEGKRSLGIPKRRWEDNIRMDLREIVWEVVDWIVNFLVPLIRGEFLY
jgi:hypothetical protein